MAERMVEACEFITFFAQGYCLQYFFGCFLESRCSNRRVNAIAVFCCYGILKIMFGCLVPAGEVLLLLASELYVQVV